SETAGHALAEVLHEDVGLGDEPIDDLTPFGFLEVDGDAALVAVVGFEIEIRPIGEIDAAQLGHSPAGIAADALLDFDHVGSEIAEQRRAHGPLLPDRPIDDPIAFERHRHGSPLRVSRAIYGDPRDGTSRGALRRSSVITGFFTAEDAEDAEDRRGGVRSA